MATTDANGRTGYEIFPADELERQELIEPQQLDDEGYLVHPGKHLIWGPPGAYKTWFTDKQKVQLAHRGHRVFACVGEGGRFAVRERLRGICRANNHYLTDLQNKLIITFETVWLDGEDGKAFIREVVLANNPTIVFIDPLISYFSGDENSNVDVKRLLRVCDQELFSRGISVVLVHHSRKVSKETVASPRGSGAFTGWADVELEFQKVEGMKQIFRVENTKQRDREEVASRCYHWQALSDVRGYDLVPLADNFAPLPALPSEEKKRGRHQRGEDTPEQAEARRIVLQQAVGLVRAAGTTGLLREELYAKLGVRGDNLKRLEESMFMSATLKLRGTHWVADPEPMMGG